MKRFALTTLLSAPISSGGPCGSRPLWVRGLRSLGVPIVGLAILLTQVVSEAPKMTRVAIASMGDDAIVVSAADGSGYRELVQGRLGSVNLPTAAPDDRRLAYLSNDTVASQPRAATMRTRTLTGDWLLIVAEGGMTGTPDGVAGAGGTLTLTGQGPWVSGLGSSLPTENAGVAVFNHESAGPIDVRTSRKVGGAHYAVVPTAVPGEYQVGMGGYLPPLAPHQRTYLLFFEGNARFRLTSFASSAGTHVRYVVGTGTQVLRFVDSDDTGIGAGAGPAAVAAQLTRVETLRSGIVGASAYAPMLFDDLPATGAWTGPGGRHGSWTCAGPLTEVSRFAGPPGRWTWTWTGAAQSGGQPPALAAYAPIGAAWSAFEPRPR